MTDEHLRLVDLYKSFGSSQVLKGVNLSIRKGEFVTLLGPSGCGKTTTLNIIAGFLSADNGEIWIGEREISGTPPHKRGLGMVFQNYALFPHMNVFDNVAFGLKLRKIGEQQIDSKVKESLRLVSLPFDTYRSRYPHQLSGGEQQRVSLARALVIEPSVLLLDEPLSNLDAKLRNAMRAEIRRIHRDVGITTIYVTHDQEEALAMSDRVAVFRSGRIAQIASPSDIYGKPESVFVADFVGHSNFIRGKVSDVSDGTASVLTDTGLRIIVPKTSHMLKNQPLTLAVRAEKVRILRNKESRDNIFEGVVETGLYMGANSQFGIRVGELRLVCHRTSEENDVERMIGTGESVYVELKPSDIIVLAEETES